MNFQEFCDKFRIVDILLYFPKFDYEKHTQRKINLYKEDFYNEKWKKIDYFNYEVSNYGRIRNANTLNIKQLKFSRYGNQVILWKNSNGQTFTLSHLVAHYFIQPMEKDQKVIHIDKNIRNNYYKNLKII